MRGLFGGRGLSRAVKEDLWRFRGSGRRWVGLIFGGAVVSRWMDERTFSDSGGGVGGNIFRLTGGSDCCLDLL